MWRSSHLFKIFLSAALMVPTVALSEQVQCQTFDQAGARTAGSMTLSISGDSISGISCRGIPRLDCGRSRLLPGGKYREPVIGDSGGILGIAHGPNKELVTIQAPLRGNLTIPQELFDTRNGNLAGDVSAIVGTKSGKHYRHQQGRAQAAIDQYYGKININGTNIKIRCALKDESKDVSHNDSGRSAPGERGGITGAAGGGAREPSAVAR